ncbi:MAG: beta-ketoacyl-[acyl-carrier-protein] synthase family protein [Alphaproteobacteria bacterium]|nr:beta-ketoacyl-[acyl-carrier-protein] synthase family protein [Alphaproteobacteria bacterium]
MFSRVVITGMSVNTPLGDTLDSFLTGLLENRSAISQWRTIQSDNIYGKIGGDLGDYDYATKLAGLEERVPSEVFHRLRRLIRRAPWSTKLSMLLAVLSYLDAGLFDTDLDASCCATIVAGHNQNSNYVCGQIAEFDREPEYIDPLFSLHALDTDHGGSVSEVLQTKGPLFTVGGACASGNLALRLAVDEIRYRGVNHVVLVAPCLDIAAIDLQAMALMGAISYESFNDHPAQASRPYDTKREGFIPAHGGASLIIESLESAQRRGARIYAEILAVEANSDGNHLPQPSQEGQTRLMRLALDRSGVRPEEIDYINAHATSTPLGDIVEINSIQEVFTDHARRLKINAPKSLLGHTCWSAPTVETVAAILQMGAGCLHRSINIEQLDPQVSLDVCQTSNVELNIDRFMKNSFGFGGINCVAIFSRMDDG